MIYVWSLFHNKSDLCQVSNIFNIILLTFTLNLSLVQVYERFYVHWVSLLRKCPNNIHACFKNIQTFGDYFLVSNVDQFQFSIFSVVLLIYMVYSPFSNLLFICVLFPDYFCATIWMYLYINSILFKKDLVNFLMTYFFKL